MLGRLGGLGGGVGGKLSTAGVLGSGEDTGPLEETDLDLIRPDPFSMWSFMYWV